MYEHIQMFIFKDSDSLNYTNVSYCKMLIKNFCKSLKYILIQLNKQISFFLDLCCRPGPVTFYLSKSITSDKMADVSRHVM